MIGHKNSHGGIVLKLLFLLVIAAIGGWAVWHFQQQRGSSPANLEFQTTLVEHGDVIETVLATGTLHPVRTVEVGSQVSGIIEEIFADFNSKVTQGMVIARIDPSTFEAELHLVEAELEAARANLDLITANARRTEALREQNLVSEAEFDALTAELKQAEANVAIRQSSVDKAKLSVERCTIISPTDGIVISRNIDVGQTVAASLSSPTLFRIADDLSRMQIITNVSEADIGRITEGRRAEFRVDAWRGEVFEGTVEQIRNAPVLIENVVTYDTVIRVNNDDLRLKPGMTAEVHIVSQEKRAVPKVRNTALRARLPDQLAPEPPEGEGTPVFLRLPDGSIDSKRVLTGVTDGVHTEILSGVSPGDELIIGLALQGAQRGEGGRDATLFRGQQAQF